MPTSVSLDDLIDALEEQSDTLLPFLDRDTGEVFLMSRDSLSLSEEMEPEDIESLPDWQQEEARLAIQIATTERYLGLPDRFEVNEWNIMREFCEGIKHDQDRASLLNAIHGNHAFRRFKDQIANRNLWEPWNRFRRSALEEILRDWCEENAVNVVSSQKQTATPHP